MSLTPPFDHQMRTRLVFGPNTCDRTGELAREAVRQGDDRVLVVSDPGVTEAGHTERIASSLRAAAFEVALFTEVHENPTTADVGAALDIARAFEPTVFVAVGGGSAIDTAKGCNILLNSGGVMRDYWGKNKVDSHLFPLIAIPTTAGTGSEVQSFALISDAKTHAKMACGDVKATPRLAILDPTLTLSMPPHVTACTGIDAITHAIESAVTNPRTPVSSMYAHEAWRLASGAMRAVIDEPGDLDARGCMLLAATLAGLAIENSMLGAAHSAANPLTAHFNVVHGHAVGLMLPHVIRFNEQDRQASVVYGRLARIAGLTRHTAAALAKMIHQVLEHAGLATSLADVGVTPASIEALAQEAADQWTARFNPQPVTVSDFAHLYHRAYSSADPGESSY